MFTRSFPGALRTLAGALAIASCCAFAPVAQAEPAKVGLIEIKGSLSERPMAAGILAEGDVLARDISKAIRQSAADASLKGLVLKLKDAELSLTQVEELAEAIAAARAAGKRVTVYSDAYDTPAMLLGAAADEVLIQAGGSMSVPGVQMQEMYLADAMGLIGIKGDFVQVGDYKGASEMLANSKPSRQWDENINGLLDGLYTNMREALKKGRKFDDSALDKALEAAWAATDEDAKKVNLVDAVVDLPDLDKHLAKALGADGITWDDSLVGGEKASSLEMQNPFAILSALMNKPEHKPKRATIAVVHIDGAIVDGESQPGGLFGAGSVGSRSIRRSLSEVERNDLIKGVIVRIDSPGGSATASEMIWQGLRRIAAKKPVWVSVGSMAASGGYYIAVAGDKIYVCPTSIVGSIGVVGGKLALAGLMEKVQVHVVERTRGPRAGLLSGVAMWTDAERRLVRDKMVQVYELFSKRVTAGRKGIELSRTAEGRLFTGNKAVELKMADKVAGFDTAVADLAQSLSMAEGSYDLLDYPAPLSFGEMIEQLLGGFTGSAAAKGVVDEMGRAALGESLWNQARRSVGALMQLRREPVILVAPRVIAVE